MSGEGLMAGAGLAYGLLSKYNPAKLRLDRRRERLEKAQLAESYRGAQSDREFRQLEDPREQAELKQSLFGRGLGKSSIAQRDTARLSDIQSRRMAALQAREEISRKGLSLFRKQRKFNKRMIPLDILGMMISSGNQATSGGAERASASDLGLE